jgi:hypothetical protein
MLITSYGADWFDFEWLTDEYRQLAFDLIQSVDYREQLIHDEFGGSRLARSIGSDKAHDISRIECKTNPI